jgi:hypothetical protein
MLLAIFGASAMGSFVAGLFFLRYWTRTRDRLFLSFTVAFWLLGIQRMVLVMARAQAVDEPVYAYVIRLVAFVVIILALRDKNRGPRGAA